MKIKIINPNTTEEMTADICKSAHYFSRTDTEIFCVNAEKGPVTIEGFYDEHLAIPWLIKELLKSEKHEEMDAYVVACFGDPGLYALRELTDKPVVGIAESALVLASFVAAKFSIVTIMPRIRIMLEDLVRRVGVGHRVASIRTPNLTVMDFMKDFEGCKRVLIEEAKDTIQKDYAEAIILGCAGMAGFAAEVEKAVRVPVFDAVASAVKVAEILVDMGMKTSKVLTYQRPERKEFKGMEELFQP
ncbi:MAG: aspartate/glutamate racemase family protein [Deltaproteobacteria bacterium]|nr:aspartate/glutamate racemase family protein [Deltaproteobacteria bacterium]